MQLWLVRVRAPRLDTAKASGEEVRVVVHYRDKMRDQGTGMARRPATNVVDTGRETAKNGKGTARKEKERRKGKCERKRQERMGTCSAQSKNKSTKREQ